MKPIYISLYFFLCMSAAQSVYAAVNRSTLCPTKTKVVLVSDRAIGGIIVNSYKCIPTETPIIQTPKIETATPSAKPRPTELIAIPAAKPIPTKPITILVANKTSEVKASAEIKPTATPATKPTAKLITKPTIEPTIEPTIIAPKTDTITILKTETTASIATTLINKLLSNEQEVATALQTLCSLKTEIGQELKQRCNALTNENLTLNELQNVTRQVTSMQTAAQATNSLQMLDTQLNAIGTRLNQFKLGEQTRGLSLRSNGVNILSENKYANRAAAGDDTSFSERLGFFINANYIFGKKDQSEKEFGLNQEGYGTTLGIDYRVADNAVIGVAFGYDYEKSDFINSQGTMKTDAFTGALYGSFFVNDNFYIDASVSGSALEYRSQRNIYYTAQQDNIRANATGKNSGHKYNINLDAGYNYQIKGLNLTPQLRINYSNVHIDDFDEQSDSGLALHIDEQDFDSLSTSLGGQISYPLSFSWGVLIPTLSVDWTHEFLYNSRTIQANFMQDFGSTTTKFNIFTESPDRDFVNLSTGVSAQFKHGVSMFFNYDTRLAHKYIDSHLFTLGVRIEF